MKREDDNRRLSKADRAGPASRRGETSTTSWGRKRCCWEGKCQEHLADCHQVSQARTRNNTQTKILQNQSGMRHIYQLRWQHRLIIQMNRIAVSFAQSKATKVHGQKGQDICSEQYSAKQTKLRLRAYGTLRLCLEKEFRTQNKNISTKY